MDNKRSLLKRFVKFDWTRCHVGVVAQKICMAAASAMVMPQVTKNSGDRRWSLKRTKAVKTCTITKVSQKGPRPWQYLLMEKGYLTVLSFSVPIVAYPFLTLPKSSKWYRIRIRLEERVKPAIDTKSKTMSRSKG